MRYAMWLSVIVFFVSAVIASATTPGGTPGGTPVGQITSETCTGPARFIEPHQTFSLRCKVTTPLGGSQMLVLPEVWIPGNGCIFTTDKPRVIAVGNDQAVQATFTNRCANPYKGSEGGLGWIIVRL